MGRLTNYFNMINSKDLEEDKLRCFHLDLKKYWPDILEARKAKRAYRRKTDEYLLFE